MNHLPNNQEIFMSVDEHTNYQVSNFGRVRNAITGRILKPSLRQGYNTVKLYCNGKQANKVVHRLVAEAFIPNPKNRKCVDHKNNIKTDNFHENLRWCSSTENNRNRTKKQNCTSKYKGVSLHRSSKKFMALIKIGKKQRYLGLFTNEIEAAQAYDTYAKLHFGEFSKINFP